MSEQCSFDTKPSVAVILLASPARGKINLCRECLTKAAAALGILPPTLASRLRSRGAIMNSKELDLRVARSVERIAGYAEQTRHTLESKAHSCTADETGRCRYCSEVVIPWLMAKGRTGELS